MTNLNTNQTAIRDLLTHARVIAVVGHSDNPARTSYRIAQFLRQTGYKVYAVNPTLTEIDGEPCYATLADVPEPIDIVNVFRQAQYLPGVVEEAIKVGAKAVWGQLAVHDDGAVAQAVSAGLDIVTDQCIKIEFMRLNIQR
ncbi:MAG: CoA-binding protein [Anaerolineae bacterium]|nr:CoA-binding protein [Anaerolineae bacterium]